MADSARGEVVLRVCRLDEAEALLRLWRQANATVSLTDTVEDVSRALALSQVCVLVAEVDSAVVGSVMGGFDGWRGNIYRLAVHPDHRRRGIARALVAEAENRLKRQGAKRITALVEKDHTVPVAFWFTVGYDLDVRIGRYVRTI